jgi:hypothetical protein
MSEKPLPFVITDRRKFNSDGEPRESVETTEPASTSSASAQNVVEMPAHAPIAADEPESASTPEEAGLPADENLPAAPTEEQMEQSRRAYDATADRIDTAIRAANPGADHPPALTFESLVQSVYMQAVLQLGGGAQPGEQPQIDLMGARSSIDMLGILAEKTRGNLSQSEDAILSSALFELRLAFLEMTQALARSAQQRNPTAPGPAGPPFGGKPGPSIVR